MTAAGSRPAAAGATAPGDAAGPGPAHRRPSPVARTMASLAVLEAGRLARSVLVLAGLVAGAAVVYQIGIGPAQPGWWAVAWGIGYGQLVLGLTVLVAAQLAAGRARRDGMAELHRSFPAAASTQVLAQLIGLLGAVPASLVLIGGTAAVLELRGAAGRPGLAALAAGVLLVIAAGAVGVAVGSRFAHPLAGALAAFALLVPFSQSNRFNDPFIWLFPWVAPAQLRELPGPLAGYPPAAAHAAMLAGLAAAAGLVALMLTVGRRRLRIGLAVATTAAVAVIGVAGAAQLRPIPAPELSRLAAAVAHPAAVQHCATARQVRYCLYPGFGGELPALQAPVGRVVAQLPRRPARPLTIQQIAAVDFTDPVLTHGHPQALLTRWDQELARAPGTASSASVIYLTAGAWPASPSAGVRFSLALAAAEWAVGLPPTEWVVGLPSSSGVENPSSSAQCVPLGQAREAVAIWLAIRATSATASELQPIAPVPGSGQLPMAVVRGTPVLEWAYPGEGASFLTALGPQPTEAGYLLAEAMTALPAQRVSRVLDGAWSSWLNWRTSQARLAAALGIPLPRVRSLALPPGGSQPPNPLCRP